MDTAIPLHGSELVDCARANAKFGVIQAAYYCGYEDRIDEFQHELKVACHQMGLHLDTLEELALTGDLVAQREVLPQKINPI